MVAEIKATLMEPQPTQNPNSSLNTRFRQNLNFVIFDIETAFYQNSIEILLQIRNILTRNFILTLN